MALRFPLQFQILQTAITEHEELMIPDAEAGVSLLVMIINEESPSLEYPDDL